MTARDPLGGHALEFRDPARAADLAHTLQHLAREVGRPVSLMHVCGSHEQAIARFGLRALLPPDLEVMMGPGCPVCVTDAAEIDDAIALARRGAIVATYGDILRVAGTSTSLASARAEGAAVRVVYSVVQAVELACAHPDRDVVFFATGFETTAVATAAAVLAGVPPNFSILSAHKFIPPAMELVAAIPGTRVEGFLAAGHAATITGWAIFEAFAGRHDMPVVVAGFEPLDILAALVQLLALVRDGRPRVVNMYPRCVTREGNRRALARLWEVFECADGQWRGIARVPDGDLRLRDAWTHLDARRRFALEAALRGRPAEAAGQDCLCGPIMSGLATPADCTLFGVACVPDRPVGACMVSSEGICRIWHQYGGRPETAAAGPAAVRAGRAG
jgi:hydrogenase expression/formation protein HypD